MRFLPGLRCLAVLGLPLVRGFVTRGRTDRFGIRNGEMKSPKARRTIGSSLYMSDAAGTPKEEANSEKQIQKTSEYAISGDKKSLMDAYRIGTIVFGSMGVVLLFMPDRTMTTLIASKLGGAAGFGIASGLCHILKGATEHDRLQSDTYKRLNIGLLGFSLMSLPAIPGEASFLPTFVPALFLSIVATLARIFGCFISYQGWVQGMGGKAAPRTLLRDVFKGAKETLGGLRVKNKGKLYRNFLILVILAAFSSLMDGIFNVRYAKHLAIGAFEISLHWSAVARLFMLSTMIYSLKDAAERERLKGTTFIQLNIMVALWAFLVGIGQTIYPLGLAPARGALMFAFGSPFIINALINAKSK